MRIRSPAALAAVLGQLIGDPQLLRRFGERLPQVKAIAEDAQEWEAIYSGLVTSSPR